jgi:hypothetical protein
MGHPSVISGPALKRKIKGGGQECPPHTRPAERLKFVAHPKRFVPEWDSGRRFPVLVPPLEFLVKPPS